MTTDRRAETPDLFDDAVAAVRDEALDPRTLEAALGRVERRLAAELAPAGRDEADHRIRGCGGFQALIPAHLAGALSEPQRILLEDHTRECVPCRRALAQARRGRPASAVVAGASRGLLSGRRGRLALAASLVGVALAATVVVGGRLGVLGPDASAEVRAIAGEMVEIEGGAARPVTAGARVERGERLRTAAGSNAVLELADGTRVELAERSELRLARRADGVVLELDRGALIVEAAEQKRGRLYVRTDDCLVSVVGTIFSVHHGTRGSRVSVLDGEVRVRRGAELAVLRPGDQMATQARLSRVALEDEIAWSRNAAGYRERIAALAELGRELDRALATPADRTSTRLLDLAPADTAVWIALPNVSGQLAEAWALVEQRVAENAALAEWWQERFGDGRTALELAQAIADLDELGSRLGDELALTVDLGGDARPGQPMAFAEVIDARGFDELLDAGIARINARAGETVLVRVEDPATAELSHDGLAVWHGDGLIVASPSVERIAALAAGGGGFAGTPLHARLAEVYERGAGWLVGVDAARLLARSPDEADRGLAFLGLADAEQLVLESAATVDGGNESRATLGFRGDRSGVAAWLAEPAPSGALDFVSADAAFAVGGLTRSPERMVDEFLAMLATDTSDNDVADLAAAESKLGFSFRDDLAAALGGDWAAALDGPWLPKPSWKLVAEVRDPARLELVLGRLVETANAEAEAEGRPAIRFEQEEVDGRRYLRFATAEGADLAYLSFVDGYLVAAPSRALIVDAIARREAGAGLVRSQAFLDRLPRDGETDFSAVVWENLGAVAGSLGEIVGTAGGDADLAEIAALATGEPTLVVAYGERDRIRLVALGAAGPLGFSFERWLALAGHLGPDGPVGETEASGTESGDAAGETPLRTAA